MVAMETMDHDQNLANFVIYLHAPAYQIWQKSDEAFSRYHLETKCDSWMNRDREIAKLSRESLLLGNPSYDLKIDHGESL